VTLLALRGVCCKIDHVLHGGIASAAVYGALVGVTAAQIEAVG
jgi:2-methylcitrate dehydratase PrpD